MHVTALQDGEMVAFSREEAEKQKHILNQVGQKYTFSIKDLLPDDAGLYQVDVENVNVFSTDFKSTFCMALWVVSPASP